MKYVPVFSKEGVEHMSSKITFCLLWIVVFFNLFITIPVLHAQQMNFTLDFEEGNLRGWTPTGDAFAHQPTLDDNPTARHRGQPSHHQGRYWIGTYEKYQGKRGQRQGDIQGDRPQGTLTSAPFTIPRGNLSFLIGGGSNFKTRVELRVHDPIEGDIRAFHETGRNSETMQRVTWELTPYAGKTGKIRIVDASSGPWGHINVDDFVFTSDPALIFPVIPVVPADERVKVPNMVGKDIRQAREMLEQTRLRLRTVSEGISDWSAGIIFRQEPTAGTEIAVGSPVDIWITVERERPAARIRPGNLRVMQGEDAVFESLSIPEGEIRERWSGPGNQKGEGRHFEIRTDQLRPGRYDIILTIMDSYEKTDEAVATLEIIPQVIEPGGEETHFALTLEWEPDHADPGQPVVFRAYIEPYSEITEYQFIFGDGNVRDWSREPTAENRYSESGKYRAYVIARIDNESVESNTAIIRIMPGSRTQPSNNMKWILIIAGIIAGAGGGYYLLSRITKHKKKPIDTSQGIQIRSHKDFGTQYLEPKTSVQTDFEIRMRKVLDKGKQDIEGGDALITDERREHG
jgi:hypothetical protein